MADTARRASVGPVRGDVADGQQIVESIWDEIRRATHVTVDLTGFNLNVSTARREQLLRLAFFG